MIALVRISGAPQNGHIRLDMSDISSKTTHGSKQLHKFPKSHDALNPFCPVPSPHFGIEVIRSYRNQFPPNEFNFRTDMWLDQLTSRMAAQLSHSFKLRESDISPKEIGNSCTEFSNV